jgi:hypothetical protein
MERILYVVSREQSMLVGYLMTTLGARASDGPLVEIKLDERRANRRLSRNAREPERRQGERRRQPSLDRGLRSRGYATVVQSEAGSSRTVESAPAVVWRPRSSWRQRAARAGRRIRVVLGLILALLAGIGLVIVVARSIDWTPAPSPPVPPPVASPPPAPPIAPRIPLPVTPRVETTRPQPDSRGERVVPAVPPPAPSAPAPPRIVRTRFSGVVLSVDPAARVLVVGDSGATGAAGRVRVELAPDARVVLSERDEEADDASRLLKDTAINVSDIGLGDYVIVERRGPEGKQLAHSIAVTFRNIK